MKNYILNFTAIASVCFLAACGTTTTTNPIEVDALVVSTELNLVQKTFSDLPNWNNENFSNFSKAYTTSCNRVLKKNSQSNFSKTEKFGKYQEWQIACRKFQGIDQDNIAALRQFFENNFIPYSARAGSDATGLFTGYYEASLNGSRQRGEVYQTPLRARPDDLVMVDLGAFRDELKGQRIAGRVNGGRLKPYETHEQIINGGLPAGQDKPLVWVDSAVDAFFLQIQGSGIVAMDDGSTMRVGYAGQNGHPYYAVGRELIKRGDLTKENVSMQSIRDWMENNPDQAQDLMTINKSYVFFTQLDSEGPLGGEGVPLTPRRSLAIDRSIIPYGVPTWLSIEHPTGSNIDKLMVTQDTGGAIRGAVRGDYFWGFGKEAEALAGAMKSKGQYWFLLPKAL